MEGIRALIYSDVESFVQAFQMQGWTKGKEIFLKYLKEQQEGTRQVFVYEKEGVPVGYATLVTNNDSTSEYKGLPMVVDFNVLIAYQNQGIGNKILEAVEAEAKKCANAICLYVGLHTGYGPAQRMYVKRGYIPDGKGAYYDEKIATPYAPYPLDDSLIIGLKKDF